MLYVPVNNRSGTPEHFPVFLGWTSTKQRIKCLAKGHNTIHPASLEIATFDPVADPLPAPVFKYPMKMK